MSTLKQKYNEEVRPALMKRFSYRNILEVPRLEKVVVNMGVGEGKENPKLLEAALRDLALITGQRPVITKAKKSVASFKVREGMSIGCKVTLRGIRMYDFVNKLINVTLPRVRDFRGISPRSFDGRGNYSLGLKEQIIFPEIVYDQVEKIQGMDITIVTTAKTDEEALELLRALGMPFRAA
ncbi:MAG: 50S ribosomal protein L5 [Firmicutes bacterium]|nr:50S ribosomal protein L5 [Bacillota bacterium]